MANDRFVRSQAAHERLERKWANTKPFRGLASERFHYHLRVRETQKREGRVLTPKERRDAYAYVEKGPFGTKKK